MRRWANGNRRQERCLFCMQRKLEEGDKHRLPLPEFHQVNAHWIGNKPPLVFFVKRSVLEEGRQFSKVGAEAGIGIQPWIKKWYGAYHPFRVELRFQGLFDEIGDQVLLHLLVVLAFREDEPVFQGVLK